MGVASGSLSISRYKILNAPKQLKLASLNESFAPFQVKRFKLQGASKELTWGWDRPVALIDEGQDQDAHWDLSDCQVQDNFLLTIRIEKRKVPTKLLQMVAKERLLKKQNKRAKPIGAKERKQLWAETKDELLALTLPDLQFIECFWNTERHEIVLFSTSKKIQAIFEELFYKSICVDHSYQMVKIDPPLLGLSLEDWSSKGSTKKMEKLTQTVPFALHHTDLSAQ